ncbi:alpha/beta hydrolase [Mycobacterium sp. OTB74]|uniref:alpha/beta fold hydrolase n=1 Tax=Mycobacterium sp. OTB74 TaxID=1853452 RepID=UPI00247423B1|nr:alpha/beta hydrolase [Mycobacterium sp. OTB74]MDH6245570.1 pimeloyl-ACP methyl ester carboxylesterase [Mycobacterium sp. OTB74]
MTSLAAWTSTDGGGDESAEHEAARLVHEAETALHDARESGVDAWSASAAEHGGDRLSWAGCQIQQAQQHHPFMRLTYRRDRTRIQSGGITRTVTTSDGVSLSVREYGSRDPAHTVVLLHGLCLAKGSWTIPIDHLLHQYGDSIRIISYDHRGHGDSAAAPMHTYHIDRLAADLADLLAALGVAGPLTLAGHSMGGMVALAYLGRPADQRPVQPDGLILVATAAGKLTGRGLGRLLATPATDVLYELARHVPRAAERAFRALARPACGVLVRIGGYGTASWDVRVAMSVATINATPVATKAGFLRALRDYDQYQTLSSITAATVVISGGADRLTPPSHAHDLAVGIPGAVRVHRPAASHMLLDEAPHEISNAIVDVIGGGRTGAMRRRVMCNHAKPISRQPLSSREAC